MEKTKDLVPKNWVMVLLTVVFILLYALAFAGVLQAASDNKLVGQIAPIISVIIGYYFGRIPGEKNEQSLERHANDARQHQQEAEKQKDQARDDRHEALVDKAKLATKIADAIVAFRDAAAEPQNVAGTLSGSGPTTADAEVVRKAAMTALNILETA